MTPKNDPSKKLVQKEETLPCGCHRTEYADGSALVSPCIPCGLMDAGNSLQRAGQALGAIATRLRFQENRAAVQAAAASVAQPKKG